MAAVSSFLVVMGLALTMAGAVVRAKFMGDSTTIVNGFYVEKRNDIDMVVLGSSNSFCTVNPLILYEEYGIAAYDFGSSSQPMHISVLYLKEALKTQKPKVVALEVNMLAGSSISSKTRRHSAGDLRIFRCPWISSSVFTSRSMRWMRIFSPMFFQYSAIMTGGKS